MRQRAFAHERAYSEANRRQYILGSAEQSRRALKHGAAHQQQPHRLRPLLPRCPNSQGDTSNCHGAEPQRRQWQQALSRRRSHRHDAIVSIAGIAHAARGVTWVRLELLRRPALGACLALAALADVAEGVVGIIVGPVAQALPADARAVGKVACGEGERAREALVRLQHDQWTGNHVASVRLQCALARAGLHGSRPHVHRHRAVHTSCHVQAIRRLGACAPFMHVLHLLAGPHVSHIMTRHCGAHSGETGEAGVELVGGRASRQAEGDDSAQTCVLARHLA